MLKQTRISARFGHAGTACMNPQRILSYAAALLAGIFAVEAGAAPPTNLRAIPGNGIVSLVWQRPDSLKTEKYNIYRSTTSGSTGTAPYVSNSKTVTVPSGGGAQDDATSYLADFGDTNATNGTTYYYQVTMVRGGTESEKSAEVQATPVAASRAVAKNRFLKIMPMGNSITAGWCGDNGVGSKGGYRGPLYDTLTKAGYNFLFVGSCIQLSNGKPYQYHEGYGSRKIQDIRRTVAGRAITSYDPDLVLLEIGTNNLAWGWDNVPNSIRAYDTLLWTILSLKPTINLLVAPILPIKNVGSDVNTFNAAIKKKIDSLEALGRNIRWAGELSSITISDISPDAVHPFEASYTKIASCWFQAITRITGATSTERPLARRNGDLIEARGGSVDIFNFKGMLVSRSLTRPGNAVFLKSGRPGAYVAVVNKHGTAVTRKVVIAR